MKPIFDVVVGYRKPGDMTGKSRPAVVLLNAGDWVLMAGMTTNAVRTGHTPGGYVRISEKSPAARNMGLSGINGETAAGIRDARWHRREEFTSCRKVGRIDLTQDQNLMRAFEAAVREFPIPAMPDVLQ